jgi:hypothetical protein
MPIKTIGGMATIKSRLGTLKEVLDRIVPQLDVVYVYLNDHAEVPAFMAAYRNVVPVLGRDAAGDLNANGKMYFLDHEQAGVGFTMDDDILYPPDYVARYLAKMDLLEGRACITAHGSIVPDHASWYYERNWTYAMKHGEEQCHIVNLLGSGVSAFPLSMFSGGEYDFKKLVYVDLQLTLIALRAGLPILTIERPENWIRAKEYDGLWEKFGAQITHHTTYLRGSEAWQSPRVREIWRSVFADLEGKGVRSPRQYLNLAPEAAGFVMGEPLSADCDSFSELSKLAKFEEIWG